MRVKLHYELKKIKWLPARPLVIIMVLTILMTNAFIAVHAAPAGKKQVVKASQNIKITGQVTDEQGLGMPGVSVVVTGTTIGTVTDIKGNYNLSIPDNYTDHTLSFSFLGYVKQEVAIGDKTVFNISLKPDTRALNEVVVVGYGTQRKISLTGAVSQVTAKDIEGKPVLNVLQALQGEAPGLIIQQTNLEPGSNVNLNIRGIGTTGDNTPLVVIDGIIGGDINTLNPNDVASVSILKDAGSAAIYGSRAANGVILITTKSGKINQKPSVSFDASYGIQHPDVLLKKVNAWDNAYYKNESLVNSGLPPAYTPEQIQQLQAQGNGTWDIQHLLQNAPLQSENVSVSGGGETNSYYISGGYQNQASNLIGNGGSGPDFGYTKYNLRMNQTSIIGKLKVNVILSYVKTQNKSNSVGDNNIFADADRVPYNYSWQDANGNFLTNPVASQYDEMGVLKQGGYSLTNNDEIFGNLNGTLNVTKDIKLTGIFGGTVTNNSDFFRRIQVNYLPSGVYGDDNTVFDNSSKQLLLNTQLFAEYNKQFKAHKFHILLGASNESYNSEGFQLQELYTDPQLGIPTTGTKLDANNSYNSNNATAETSLDSFFGRVNYSYKDRYFLEGDFREDGSSKFASGKRWGFFPSVAGSWLASEESFMQPLKNVINTLKFRASYGVLGNQNVNAYQYQTTYFPYQNAYGFNNNVVGGAGYILGNPALTWERAATLNLGVDAAFLNNSLNVSVDYFNKTTSDILAPRSDVPALYGAGFPDFNISKVQNKGWEATVSYTLKTDAVTQNFSFNIANSSNKLLAFSYGANQQIAYPGEFELIREVGGPITQYYGYKVAGIFQTEAEVQSSAKPAGLTLAPGDLKYVDQNHDGVIDQKDMVPLGDPFPHFTFGFTYRVAVKGFDLSLFIQGVGKRIEFIRGETVEPFHYNYGQTLFENQTNFWTPSNPGATYPRLAAIGSDSNTNNWRDGSDIYSFNAAYARLKNVNIGYTFPHDISKKIGMEKLRISLIGQNLYTLTKLKFIDPENTQFDNNTGMGIGANSGRSYPMPVFYGLGLNVTF
jgi:TonB-linked SusC/RagA family outer membrane protein